LHFGHFIPQDVRLKFINFFKASQKIFILGQALLNSGDNIPVFKIKHKRELCVGCGACAAACDNWKMDAKDGKSRPKKTELDEIGCNQDAADSCPVQCISIIKL